MTEDKPLSEKEIKPDNKKKDNGFYWSKDIKEVVEKFTKRFKSNITVISKRKFLDGIKEDFGEFK